MRRAKRNNPSKKPTLPPEVACGTGQLSDY